MSSLSLLTSWYLWAGLVAIPLLILISDFVKWLRMPPGPTPIPFIGNKLPARKPWIQFQEWSKVYGPVFTIWVGRRPTLVISDPVVAVDLMEKRSNKYSSRPRFVVMGEIYNNLASVLVQPYGKEWSLRRKLLHQALTPAALRTYKARQQAEASRLVFGIMQDPITWERQFDRFTSSVVFTISYGHRVDSMEATVIRDRLDYMQYMASLNVPGAYLAESFPLLRHLPNILAPWKKDVQDHGRSEAEANMALLETVKQDVEAARQKGTSVPPSLGQSLLALQEKEPIHLSPRNLSFIPASLFGAGSDTTASTLCSAILALVTHPSALQAVQAELDSIVGPTRTPTFADEPQLPYLRALVHETLRWRPVAVLGGTPHASTEDDIYEGWRIPAGTTVLGNSWAINLNPAYYPNPDLFSPERFLERSDPRFLSALQGKPHPAKMGHSSFGWGRRICPGADLAVNSLFVALGKLCWVFEIKGVKGKLYDTGDYTDGFNIRPRSFECVMKVRSEQHRLVLETENREAEREMQRFPVFD